MPLPYSKPSTDWSCYTEISCKLPAKPPSPMRCGPCGLSGTWLTTSLISSNPGSQGLSSWTCQPRRLFLVTRKISLDLLQVASSGHSVSKMITCHPKEALRKHPVTPPDHVVFLLKTLPHRTYLLVYCQPRTPPTPRSDPDRPSLQ